MFRRAGGGPELLLHAKLLAEPDHDGDRLEHRRAVDDEGGHLTVGVERQELGLLLITLGQVELDPLVGHAELGEGAGDG
jgi:hypothetical protein